MDTKKRDYCSSSDEDDHHGDCSSQASFTDENDDVISTDEIEQDNNGRYTSYLLS